jgi:hypothetical protein
MKTIALLFLLLLTFWTGAQEPAPDDQMPDTLVVRADLFEGEKPLEMILQFNLKQYQREKYLGEYAPVDLTLVVNDSLSVHKEVRVKARGNFRRSHCSFAPFWLNIRKADVQNVHLQDTRKIKVVTHCQGSKSYEDYVLKEFLAYRIYELLEPVSFRVRLIRMKYVDTGRKDRVTESWAFMIEPEEMLAERFDALVIKNDQLGMVHMRPREILKVALFEYMIGNADYSVAGRHNIKIMGREGFGTLGYTPVPYDFDYTGFVNAHYAIPGDHLGITSVRERYYLGPCASDSAYLDILSDFGGKEAQIRNLIMDFTYLKKSDREELVEYVDQFFREAKSDHFISNKLRGTCRELTPQNGGAPGHGS